MAGAFVASGEPQRPLMRDFIGINGHTVSFKPDLYQPVSSLVRDYHPVEWDLGKNTSVLPPFPQAKNGVDWSSIYGSWRAKGWNIDVSLMFETIKLADWTHLEPDAKAYGQSFAREFGPSGERHLIDSVEIGNEPGKWSDPDYMQIFKAMSEGIRAGDPKLKIATCYVTTGKSNDYAKNVSCVEKFPELFDVLNVHTYAMLENWPTWRRSFPEDPKLPHYLQDITNVCNWRDTHTPGKEVWVTEFGYDSTTKPAPATGDFAKWVGVTDTQQAQWLVRSFLVFSTMPIDRAYLYYFNDEDEPGLHASSGITRHFTPKPAFYALEQLQKILGQFRFSRIVENRPGELRVQEYTNDTRRIVWVAWSPTGGGQKFTTILRTTPHRLLEAHRMRFGEKESPGGSSAYQEVSRTLNLTVDESPLYLIFAR
jgi:serine/threonine-protein kinase ATR